MDRDLYPMVVFTSLSCTLSVVNVLFLLLNVYDSFLVTNLILLISCSLWSAFVCWLLDRVGDTWSQGADVKSLIFDHNFYQRFNLASRIIIWLNVLLFLLKLVERWKFNANVISNHERSVIELHDLGLTSLDSVGEQESSMGRLLNESVYDSHVLAHNVDEEEDEEAVFAVNQQQLHEAPSDLESSTTALDQAETIITTKTVPKGRSKWNHFIFPAISVFVLALIMFDVGLDGYMIFTTDTNTQPVQWAKTVNIVTTSSIYVIMGTLVANYVIFLGLTPNFNTDVKLKPFVKNNYILLVTFFGSYLVSFVTNIYNLANHYVDLRWLALIYTSFDLIFVTLGYRLVQVVDVENYHSETRTILGRVQDSNI